MWLGLWEQLSERLWVACCQIQKSLAWILPWLGCSLEFLLRNSRLCKDGFLSQSAHYPSSCCGVLLLLLTVVSQSLAVLFATLLGCTMGVVLDGQ